MSLRCPLCHNPVTTAAEGEGRLVRCHACGTTFEAAGQPTGSYQEDVARRLAQYELLAVLGAGAFGVVWRARDTALDREVAVKVPRQDRLGPAEAAQFLREARAAAQLRHPNIVTVHEVGRAEDTVFIVSAFVPGVSLADWLTGRRLTPREAATLAAKVADALDYAHGQGVVHRDVKPGNILVTNTGEPHLVDFGLARRKAGEVTVTLEGQVLGTPAYMSPEQARGESHEADARSDVYSLGVVLFQLLTGELPFRGNVRMILHQVLHDEPPGPRRLDARVPRDLEVICLKCLEKDPGRRYPSARALADDLGRFLDGRPIVARPATVAARLAKWARRRPAVAGLLAAVVAVAAAGFGLVFWQWQRAEAAADLARDEAGKARAAAAEAARLGAAAEAARRLAERQAALGALTTAQNLLAREGQIGRGLLWLSHSLEHVEAAGAEDLRRFAWRNLVLWAPQVPALRHVLAHDRQAATTAAAFHPTRPLLATGGSDQIVRFWDLATGAPALRPLAHDRPVSALAFSPDGALLACGEGTVWKAAPGGVRLWDWATGQPRGPAVPLPRAVHALAFSPDGRTLVTGCGDGTARRWTVTPALVEAGPPVPHGSPATGVAWSPDGQSFLVGGSRAERYAPADRAQVYEAGTGRPCGPAWATAGGVLAVAYHPAGRLAATATTDTVQPVRLWDVTRGVAAATLPDGWNATQAAFSPDGRYLLVSYFDYTVRLWDVATRKVVGEPLPHPGYVYGVAWHPDGTTFLTLMRAGVRVWQFAAGRAVEETVWPAAGPIHFPQFSPDGRFVAVLAGEPPTVQLHDLATGRSGPVRPVPFTVFLAVNALAVSAAGPVAAVGGQAQGQGRIAVWRGWDTAAPLVLELPGQCRCLALSPDGRWLVSGGDEYRVRLWDLADGRLVGEPGPSQGGVISVLAFGPTGDRYLSGTWRFRTQLWDLRHQAIGAAGRHGGALEVAAFSPAGDRYAAACWGGFTTQVGEVGTGRAVGPALPGGMGGLAFSPDGTLLAGHDQEQARLWDLATFRQLGPALTIGPRAALAFPPDGRHLLTMDAARVLRRWELPPAPDGADARRVRLWVELITGKALAREGETVHDRVESLNAAAHAARAGELAGLGGPPLNLELTPARRDGWHRTSATAAERARAWFAAAWHLDRALAAAAPDHQRSLRRRRADAWAEHALEVTPPEPASLTRATADFAALAMAMATEDREALSRLALLRLALGDRPAWRAAVGRLLERPDPAADRLALLDPEAAAIWPEAVRRATAGATQAAALVRRGQAGEAAALLDRVGPTAAVQLRTERLWRALAERALGNPAAARRWLGAAEQERGEVLQEAAVVPARMPAWPERLTWDLLAAQAAEPPGG